MAESKSHKQAKAKAAGKKGRTEVPLKGGGRLDAKTSRRATEIERSGNPKALEKAASRLPKSRAQQKVLQVPQKDMDMAATAMRKKKVSGTVKNMSSSKRRHIK